MPSQKPFLNFVIDPELLERIDAFRFENRFASRAAAIKWLLQWALDHCPSKASVSSGKAITEP